jgi:hypothetical protein
MLWDALGCFGDPPPGAFSFEFKDRKRESLKSRLFGVPFKYDSGVDPSATMSLTFLSTFVTASIYTLSYCP